jgi:hypothetical protein
MDTMARSSMENLGSTLGLEENMAFYGGSITIMGSLEENTRGGSSQIIGKSMQLDHASMITNICKIKMGWFILMLYAHVMVL